MKLHLSGDESRDMWEDINSIKPEKLQNIIYHIMCHVQNAEGELDARMNIVEGWVKAYTVAPPKPNPTDEELVEKYADLIQTKTYMDESLIWDVEQILRQFLSEVRR